MFPSNIYSGDELEEMDIETQEKYTGIIYISLEYYPLFEKAIKNGDICDEVRSFLLADLNECYSTIGELREDICHVSVPKRLFSSKKNFVLWKVTSIFVLHNGGFL